MSESLLKAFMQLFALASGIEDITKESRKIVEQFLNQELNQELAQKYIVLYDRYKKNYHDELREEGGTDTIAATQKTVNKVATEINKGLTQNQKLVILLRIMEYIYADLKISDHEFEFLKTVSGIFHISQKEFDDCLAFIQSTSGSIPDRSELLIINSDEKLENRENNHHLSAANLNGKIVVLRISSINMFAFRYFGDSELLLNSQPITEGKIYILTNGASIRGPAIHPVYYSDVVNSFLKSRVTTNIVFTARDLEYEFKTGGMGVRNVTLSEDSGNLIGIMGSSGSGKTTLLNVLNGNLQPTSGKVTLNGIDIHREKKKIEGVIGYVSQDDLLFEELTVFQNLYYNAQLSFKDHPREKIVSIVNSLLQSLGLYEARHLKVGNPIDKIISGGQRKRLNIALELIRKPSVLFVDEPTSGLSSRDSENIMDLLKELALKGKLIFVVIHQPSSEIFKMFDKLLILDTGGFPIFYGNPIDSVIYFKQSINHVKSWESECHNCGNVNPEQIFNIVEAKVLDEYGNKTDSRKTLPGEWYNRFKENIAKKIPVKNNVATIPKSTFSIPGKLKQFKVFITRDLLSKLTNSEYLLINFLETPVLAFILAYFVKFYPPGVTNKAGYIFFENDNIPAFIFMAVIVALFVGLTVSAEEIIRDRKIRKREKFLNLSTGSYLGSKILIMFSLSALQTLFFVLVGNSILGIKGMYYDYWLVLFSTACFANLLGLNISSTFNSAVTIYILIPLLLIPQLLFSGVLVKFDKLNPTITSQDKVPFIGELMASRWAFEGLAVNQFKHNRYEKEIYKFDKRLSNTQFRKSYWIPALEGKVNFIESNLGSKEKAEEIKIALTLIRGELKEYNEKNPLIKFDPIEKLNTPVPAKTLDKLKQYLKNIRLAYVEDYNKAMQQRDRKLIKLKEQGIDINQLKRNYKNERLSSLVTNKSELDKIIEVKGELIAQSDAIFRPSERMRAHFFAPAKSIFDYKTGTYWFNILVLWVMTILLIITLYFDAFRKLTEWIQNQGERIISSRKGR